MNALTFDPSFSLFLSIRDSGRALAPLDFWLGLISTVQLSTVLKGETLCSRVEGKDLRQRIELETMTDEGGGDSTKMTEPNGQLHPTTSDTRALPTPGKRKRGSQDDPSTQDASSSTESQEKVKLQEMLRNLVEILNRCVFSY